MTPAQFIALFPEFEDTRPALVSGRLALALVDMGGPDFSVWPPLSIAGQPFTLTDMAQAYKAAHLLLTSPFGTEFRLKEGMSATSYSEEYDRICIKVGIGGVVAGQGGWTAQATTAGSLVLNPGSGTVSVTNGSMAIGFSVAQTLPAGTVMVFVGAQPGAYYALAANITASTTGALTAPYTGATNPASLWNVGNG